MSARRIGCCAAVATLWLLTGCHHKAPVRAAVLPPPPPASAGPVMVAVPPPSHRSGDAPDLVATSSDIPVVKPVRPPRKFLRRPQPPPPVAATNTPAVVAPVAAPVAPPVAAAPKPAQSLGQLTASTDDPSATRDGAAQALRRERDRIGSIPAAVQSAHPAEVDQARRFLKSAAESWSASDYAATLALTTKARVLLDDLLK